MERLMTYLKQTPEGEIADTAELEELLAEGWDEVVLLARLRGFRCA